MTRIPTIQRTNLQTITPKRLQSEIDYSVYKQFTDFMHRGSRCQVDRLLSYLGASIDNAAIQAGSESAPSTLSEFDVVNVVIDAVASKYPAWFGEPNAVQNLDQTISDYHLAESDLREQYWQEQLNSDDHIEGDNWSEQKRVIIPLTGLILQSVRIQKQADSHAATGDAQDRIKKTVMRESYENDLSEHQVQQAVNEALGTLRS
ncbi:hypothetical protein [Haloarcula sp. K1]|uniref:hypothetical protein n=1 Tax=Haloarcula sp. K1 TaxID=1622207 RepID=UPI0007BAF9A7|nr:hypothetical protein [Haloarcula sp. K1]KZX46228.1 hypothetical protein AV929_15760 [Haloarcula sp. K1]